LPFTLEQWHGRSDAGGLRSTVHDLLSSPYSSSCSLSCASSCHQSSTQLVWELQLWWQVFPVLPPSPCAEGGARALDDSSLQRADAHTPLMWICRLLLSVGGGPNLHFAHGPQFFGDDPSSVDTLRVVLMKETDTVSIAQETIYRNYFK
jgi:hypothetical protein